MKLSILFSLLLLCACSPIAPEDSKVPTDGERNSAPVSNAPASDEALCQAKGGIIKPVCKSQEPTCIYPYADAGKACHDSSECEGKCQLSQLDIPAGAKTTGACSTDNNPCGCFALVKNGRAQPVICID